MVFFIQQDRHLIWWRSLFFNRNYYEYLRKVNSDFIVLQYLPIGTYLHHGAGDLKRLLFSLTIVDYGELLPFVESGQHLIDFRFFLFCQESVRVRQYSFSCDGFRSVSTSIEI